MALFAGRSRMQADEREICQIVVENHFFTPAAFLVTAGTICPLLATMYVIGFVTVVTATVEFVLQIAPMAAVAGNIGMLATQGEIGLAGMIKTRL